MSEVPQGRGWWLASDGKWYPPATPPPSAGPGWWLASDGTWYPPAEAPAAAEPPPAMPTPPAPASPGSTSRLAVVSLVLGCLSLITWITGIFGVIVGLRARREIKASGGREGGSGLALGGIITSAIGLTGVGVFVLALLAVTFLGRTTTTREVQVGTVVGADRPTTTSSTRPLPTTTINPLPSVAGQPCVAPVGPFPPGAPTVPVEVGRPPTSKSWPIQNGSGQYVSVGDDVTVRYIGVACTTGLVVDSTYAPDRTVTIPAGPDGRGWPDLLVGRHVGDQLVVVTTDREARNLTQTPLSIAPGETIWYVMDVVDRSR